MSDLNSEVCFLIWFIFIKLIDLSFVLKLLVFDDIDCNEVLRDIDFESGLNEFYDSIKNDVEECEEEEIAQKVLTGVLKGKNLTF